MTPQNMMPYFLIVMALASLSCEKKKNKDTTDEANKDTTNVAVPSEESFYDDPSVKRWMTECLFDLSATTGMRQTMFFKGDEVMIRYRIYSAGSEDLSPSCRPVLAQDPGIHSIFAFGNFEITATEHGQVGKILISSYKFDYDGSINNPTYQPCDSPERPSCLDYYKKYGFDPSEIEYTVEGDFLTKDGLTFIESNEQTWASDHHE